MSLSLYVPHRLFSDDWSVVDPLFSSLIRNNAGDARSNRDFNSLAPILTADIIESETDYHIHCDLPGVDASDLEVNLDGKYLTIKAERKHVHKTGTDKVHSMERTYGKVERSIRLPANVDSDNVQSKFKNGVLSIVVPKKAPPAATSRKITVDTA